MPPPRRAGPDNARAQRRRAHRDGVAGLVTLLELFRAESRDAAFELPSRISGVSPADISVILVYLEQLHYQQKREQDK